MSGSALNWSPSLYIMLLRRLTATRKLHRLTFEAMRLRRCHRTSLSLIGMLNQVKRLIGIETEEMFNSRKQKEAEHRALRSPIVVNHAVPAALPPEAT